MSEEENDEDEEGTDEDEEGTDEDEQDNKHENDDRSNTNAETEATTITADTAANANLTVNVNGKYIFSSYFVFFTKLMK